MANSPRKSPAVFRAEALAAAVLALAAFVLAWASPVEDVDADPAVALLVSQAFLDHGTWRLDPYVGDPACAYDIENDYRIRPQDGSYAYYSLSVPVLSLPFVWLANRFRLHMLDQQAEFALQNLLSATCCALLAALLYLLCRRYLEPAASLVLAAVAVFGSSLTSTLATGLWNLDYAVVLLAAALLHVVRRFPEDPRPPTPFPARTSVPPGRARLWAVPALLAALAFLCRPTAAFAIVAAILVFGVLASRRRGLWLLAAGAGLAVALAGLWLLSRLPEGVYYRPRKLVPRTAPWIGLYGVLLSPSRGLLVFSPFLALVAGGAAVRWRRLWCQALFRFAALWIGLHLLAVSVKEIWWGGHSYGPRLLTELMVPLTLVACLLWRDLADTRRSTRRLLAAAFLVLGTAAVLVHSVQGLFNPAVKRFNVSPDVDRHPELLFDWRHPQFLATEASLAARLEAHRRRSLAPYRPGDEIGPDSDHALFRRWYGSEGLWRWSQGEAPEIVLELGEVDGGGTWLFELVAGANGFQTVTTAVNGSRVGRFVARGFEPERRLFAFAGELLVTGDNVLSFEVPGAAPTDTDDRVLGLALRSLRLLPLPADFAGVGYADETFFGNGWSVAENGWRWSDGPRAVIFYPIAEVTGTAATLEIHAGAFGEQRVEIRLDGVALGELRFDVAWDTRRLSFDAGLLRPSAIHRVELGLPDARSPDGDARTLGLSLVRLTIRQE